MSFDIDKILAERKEREEKRRNLPELESPASFAILSGMTCTLINELSLILNLCLQIHKCLSHLKIPHRLLKN